MGARDVNPWVGINFISDNPRMAVPPAWFLQRLYDFDSMLVVLPSRTRPFAYVIARRRQRSPGLTERAIDEAITVSDTKMCLLHGLVPVCLMYRLGERWDVDPVIRSLAARDLWAMGGADAVADALEAQEAAEAEKLRREIRDDLWNRSGDAWRSYQMRTGQAVSLSSQAGLGHRTATSSSGSTARSGPTPAQTMFVHDR